MKQIRTLNFLPNQWQIRAMHGVTDTLKDFPSDSNCALMVQQVFRLSAALHVNKPKNRTLSRMTLHLEHLLTLNNTSCIPCLTHIVLQNPLSFMYKIRVHLKRGIRYHLEFANDPQTFTILTTTLAFHQLHFPRQFHFEGSKLIMLNSKWQVFKYELYFCESTIFCAQ